MYVLVDLHLEQRPQLPGLRVPFPDKQVVRVVRVQFIDALEGAGRVNDLQVDLLLVEQVLVLHRLAVTDHLA